MAGGLGALVPLIVLFIVVGVASFIGYGLYQWSNELADRASKKMEAKNVSFSKEGGLRVGVKELKDESYVDKTQNVLVNVWNNASFPNYKSSLGWNKPRPANTAAASSASASSRPSGAQRSGTPIATGPARAEAPVRRSGPNVPGGW